MTNEYATIVCPNGGIISFRLRDHDYNRFKAYLMNPSSDTHIGQMLMMDFMSAYSG